MARRGRGKFLPTSFWSSSRLSSIFLVTHISISNPIVEDQLLSSIFVPFNKFLEQPKALQHLCHRNTILLTHISISNAIVEDYYYSPAFFTGVDDGPPAPPLRARHRHWAARQCWRQRSIRSSRWLPWPSPASTSTPWSSWSGGGGRGEVEDGSISTSRTDGELRANVFYGLAVRRRGIKRVSTLNNAWERYFWNKHSLSGNSTILTGLTTSFNLQSGWLTSFTLCCFLDVLVSRMIWMREVSRGGYSTDIVSSVVLTRNYLD